jgi:hypothetical protein
MIFHSLRMGFAAIVLSCRATTGTARAGTVDLFGLPGNFNQGNFGTSLSFYYSQSILADDANWSSLSFGVTNPQAANFDLIISGGRPTTQRGSGFLPDAAAVLSRQMLDHLGGGLQVFDVDLNLPVVSGTTYFFTLAAFGKTIQGATVRATEFNGTDKYAQGEFLFANNNAAFSNTLAWNSRFSNREDLAFSASFDSVSAVPVPPTLPLFVAALGMLGLLGWWRRREAVAQARAAP